MCRGASRALSFVAQTLGIKYTTVSNAAFITGLYIIVAPVSVVVLDRRLPGGMQILSVGVALGGLMICSAMVISGLRGRWKGSI